MLIIYFFFNTIKCSITVDLFTPETPNWVVQICAQQFPSLVFPLFQTVKAAACQHSVHHFLVSICLVSACSKNMGGRTEGTIVWGDKMSPRWVDQTFVLRFPTPHNDTPRAHNGTLRDELGRQRRKSLFGAHAWAARGQKASLETALAAAKEEGNLFIIQSKRKKGRGELLHRKARQNTLWGRNEGWIIQGGSGTV